VAQEKIKQVLKETQERANEACRLAYGEMSVVGVRFREVMEAMEKQAWGTARVKMGSLEEQVKRASGRIREVNQHMRTAEILESGLDKEGEA